MTDHDAREALREALRKAFQFIDMAAGEGLHYQAAGHIWDAGDIMFELAHCCDIADPEASVVDPMVDAIAPASLPAPTPAAGDAVAWMPIETAPRDGSWFLGYWPVEGREYRAMGTSWFAHGSLFSDCVATFDGIQPTHWMPLLSDPQPPEQCANIAQKQFAESAKCSPHPTAPDGDDFETRLKRAVEAYDEARNANFANFGSDLRPYDWHRSALIAALGNHSPDAGGVGEAWVCDGIPDEVIEAGISAWDAAKHDMENYVSGVTTDWDEGMIVAAIYKAMSAALNPADAEGGEKQLGDSPGE